MKFFADNWFLFVVLVAFIVIVVRFCKIFSALPSETQIAKIKEWLLYIVIEAEKQFGSGTGRVKLSWVYSQFVKAFPSLVPIISFEMFSKLVDEVLEQMRLILQDNSNVRAYVEDK